MRGPFDTPMPSKKSASTSLDFCHVDLDAFFASVEELDNPALCGKPMAVAGSSARGILTTCNYEARKFGLHSAMPVFQAKRLCPEITLVPVRHKRYREMSARVFEILHSYTRYIEPMSIDEAYLDISRRHEDRQFLAESIQTEVQEKTGLSISIGISYNKFLAKLASDWNKPHGIRIITPDEIPEILFPLPLERVHGVGRVAAKKLRDLGLSTIGDLYPLTEEFLIQKLGKQGREVYRHIRGIDDRQIETVRDRKSLGVERTYPVDIDDDTMLLEKLHAYAKMLDDDLKKKHMRGRTITLKLKDADFKTITRSRTIDHDTNEAEEIFDIVQDLFSHVVRTRPIRLAGITLSNLVDDDVSQIGFL